MRLFFFFLINGTSPYLMTLGAPFLRHSALVQPHFAVVQDSCGTPRVIDLRASVLLILSLFTLLKRCGNSQIHSIDKTDSGQKLREVEGVWNGCHTIFYEELLHALRCAGKSVVTPHKDSLVGVTNENISFDLHHKSARALLGLKILTDYLTLQCGFKFKFRFVSKDRGCRVSAVDSIRLASSGLGDHAPAHGHFVSGGVILNIKQVFS